MYHNMQKQQYYRRVEKRSFTKKQNVYTLREFQWFQADYISVTTNATLQFKFQDFVCVHVPTFIFQQEEKGTNSHFLLSRQVTYIPLPPKFGLKWWPTKCWIWLTTIFSSFLGSLSIQKTNVSLCTIRSVKLNFVDFVNESWKSV